jgi:hypothetical protein
VTAAGSIFWDFNLPNATTWFYFSWLLAMALFFKFSRWLSIRNWDVITLFILMPGLLLIQEAHQVQRTWQRPAAVSAAEWIAGIADSNRLGPWLLLGRLGSLGASPPASRSMELWLGYLWLLAGSLYFFFRCLLDLALVRRPLLAPNLNCGGLAWLAAALFLCLSTVAFRPSAENPRGGLAREQAGSQSISLDLAQQQLEQRVPAEVHFGLLRLFAVLCHLSVVLGLIVIGWRHFQDTTAGMAAATFYLLLPYTGLFVGNWQHVWPMAVIVWAVAAYRRPLLAGLLLGLATGVVFFPALILPVWMSFYRGRGLGRFLAAFVLAAGSCLAILALFLWLRGELLATVHQTLALASWQPWQELSPSQWEGFWAGIHWAYRMPVFILYLAFVVLTLFWPAPKDLAQVIALSAALLIGLQLWYADQGGIYVLWYLPLLLLLVFRPNLSERRPPPIVSQTDWLHRSWQRLAGLSAWLSRRPPSAAPAP